MVLSDELHKPFQRMLALFLGQTVDVLYMVADCEYGFPSCYRIGTNDRVNCSQVVAHIFRSTARLGVQLEVVLFGGLVEFWLRVCGSEIIEKLLIRLGQAIIEIVARSPECV